MKKKISKSTKPIAKEAPMTTPSLNLSPEQAQAMITMLQSIANPQPAPEPAPKTVKRPPLAVPMEAPEAVAKPFVSPMPVFDPTIKPKRPGHIEKLNTAKLSMSNGYHRLRYHLLFLEKKWKKSHDFDEARLVMALTKFNDQMGPRMKDLTDSVLVQLVKKKNISDDTLDAVAKFRKKFMR